MHDECFAIPDGEIDVYSIVSGRRRLQDSVGVEPQLISFRDSIEQIQPTPTLNFNRSLESGITAGKGWEVWGEPAGYCDGTYNAVCSIQDNNECALQDHHAG